MYLTKLQVILKYFRLSEELFKIHSINRSNVITYKIKDLNNEMIKGIFYERELQKTKNISQVYIIETRVGAI